MSSNGEELRYTSSGIPLKPVYTPQDLEGLDLEKDIAQPGQYPFTRGLYPTGYRKFTWMKREVSGFGLPEETNARQKFLMQHGQEAYAGQPTVNLIFDLPTEQGWDSDDPMAEGEVGRCGVICNSVEDMDRLFDGLPLENINTSFIIYAPSPVMLAMYIVAAEKRGTHRSRLAGVATNNSLAGHMGSNFQAFPPRPSLRMTVDLMRFCTKEMPLWNIINFDGYNIRDAGCTAVQEVAFTMCLALEVIQSCIQSGMVIDEFAPRLSFFWSSHSHFFEEIGKIRAARRMWARIMRERFGAVNPRSWYMRCHTQTAGYTLTAKEPLNNIARTAIQALAAVLGGTQGLHTNSYDEAYCIPSDEAVRVAVKTQKIIEHETGVCDVADPLGGSYYVEWITSQMEQEALKYIQRVDDLGGFVAAIEKGYIQAEISGASLRYQREVESGQRVVVGVNKYASEAAAEICSFEYNPRLREIAVERLKELRQRRDNSRVQQCLGAIKAAASEQSVPVMPLLIEAARANATLGEMMGAMREVFGLFDRQPVLAKSGC
ncbi:MAG: methylmalonyl-CoA mutase family protein [Dehalococcoidia bacterium]|nr:methylmalonyl-CoA mutase family protein [Dehalococcoidia bacterium]